MEGARRDESSSRGDGPREIGRLFWAIVIAASWIAASLYLTQVTSLPRDLRRGLDDTVSHFGLGILVTGCLICLVRAFGWRGGRLMAGGIAAAVFGAIFLVGTELLQATSLVRQPELSDAAADIAGVIAVTFILLWSFRARHPAPDWAATGFSVAASFALVVVIVTVLVAPPALERERTGPVQVELEVDPTPCIEDIALPPNIPPTGRRDLEPAAEPLLQFDLAADLDRSQGPLASVGLIRHGTVQHRPGVGAVFGGGRDGLVSAEPVDGLLADIADAQQFSVDTWIALGDLGQTGPARVVALADGTKRTESNFHLGVEGDQISVRLRTACDETNWVLVGSLVTGPNHLALTVDRGDVRVYLNGETQVRYQLIGADLGDWLPSVPLSIGNEATLSRPLQATVSVVRVWPIALSNGEIADLADDSGRSKALRP